MVGTNMKSYYTIWSGIEVEAADEDQALWLLKDTIGFSGFRMVRWVNTTLSEGERNDDN
jgi:hypothetical protein